MVALHCRPKVLKDYSVDMPADIDSVSAKFLASVDSKITKALFLEKMQNGSATSTNKSMNKKEDHFVLISNEFFLLSLDNSLRKSTGCGLAKFHAEQCNFKIGHDEEVSFSTLARRTRSRVLLIAELGWLTALAGEFESWFQEPWWKESCTDLLYTRPKTKLETHGSRPCSATMSLA